MSEWYYYRVTVNETLVINADIYSEKRYRQENHNKKRLSLTYNIHQDIIAKFCMCVYILYTTLLQNQPYCFLFYSWNEKHFLIEQMLPEH